MKIPRLALAVLLAAGSCRAPAHHQAYLDEVVLVDDDALAGAMRLLLDRAKLVAEPSGAITVAALLSGAARARGRTVVVLSGGNVEWDGLREVLGRGE